MRAGATLAFAAVTGFLLAVPAGAQAPVPASPPARGATGETGGLAELQPPPGGYTYSPQGRRDPFMSLLRPVAEAGPRTRKPGLEGFLIQELALKGIVKDKDGYIALLQDPTGKSHFPRVGQRFFDGAIIAMDGATVTFRQEVTDPLSPVKTREVKKSLYPSEEARQ